MPLCFIVLSKFEKLVFQWRSFKLCKSALIKGIPKEAYCCFKQAKQAIADKKQSENVMISFINRRWKQALTFCIPRIRFRAKNNSNFDKKPKNKSFTMRPLRLFLPDREEKQVALHMLHEQEPRFLPTMLPKPRS